MDNIYYGESGTLEITPFKEGHQFDPANRNIVLTMENPIRESVNFIDTTTITVAGTINFIGTDCKVAGVELYINNTPTGKFTNDDG